MDTIRLMGVSKRSYNGEFTNEDQWEKNKDILGR